MFDRDLIKLVAPPALLGGLLLTLGVAAAWVIHGQQVAASGRLTRETESLLAVHDFYVSVRDIRKVILASFRDSNAADPLTVARLRKQADEQFQRLSTFDGSASREELIGEVGQMVHAFWTEFDRISETADRSSREQRLRELVDSKQLTGILEATDRLIHVHHHAAEKAGESQHASFSQFRWAFLILGICGGAAGILAGIIWAKSFRRSIVQLEVSVRSAAGILESVSGPVRMTRSSGMRNLELGLGQMETRIGELIGRVQRSESELMRNEQLAGLGQLAAGIAHEIRNPLMPIKMLVQSALERNDGVGLHGKALHVVDEEIRRLERTIQMFLEFARPVPPRMGSLDIRGEVESTIELIRTRAKTQRIDVRFDAPNEAVEMVADAGQLKQVVLNILLNALDALSDGGAIQVKIRRLLDTEVPEVSRGISWCAIVIADNGPGIPVELQARVFEPFVTSKETGTGLGLSICQRIVQAHGGELTAKSELTKGAEFTIRLPCLPPGTVADGEVGTTDNGRLKSFSN